MLKIANIINDTIEKHKIKSHLNKAKREIEDIDFKLAREFVDNREAINYLYQNSDIDILIVENNNGQIFSGLDLLMLAEEEFPETGILLLNESQNILDFKKTNIENLTAVINKRESYNNFVNSLKLSLLKQQQKTKKRKKKKEKLKDYRTIIDHTHDAIFLLEVDCDGNFYYKRINKTHQRLTALNDEEIRGKTPVEIFGSKVGKELEKNYRKCLETRSPLNYTEEIKFPAGTKNWQTSLYPVVRNGRVEEIVGSSYDITHLENQQQKLEYIKRHDKLTGLYNKRYFNQLYKELYSENDLALILINIENFNFINSYFSYKKGNQLLKEVGLILAQITDENKTAARLCADHFALILKNQEQAEINKILDYIKKEFSRINIDGIIPDISAVVNLKPERRIAANDLFNDGVTKLNLYKYKKSCNSYFYNSLMNYLKENDYRDISQNNKLLEITKKAAEVFDLSKNQKNRLLSLARHHNIGKLTVDKNILKKGDSLTAEEWKEYKKYLISSTAFAASYYDLSDILDLIYCHQENYDGSGWPEGLKGEKIPYLNRIFSVIDFYSNLKSNYYYPLFKDRYYFAALKYNDIIKELNKYKGKLYDPLIVDKFIKYLNNQN